MRWFLFCYWYEPDAPSDPVGLVRLWTLARPPLTVPVMAR